MNNHRIIFNYLLRADKRRLCVLFDNFLYFSIKQSRYIIRKEVYSKLKENQIISLDVPQVFSLWMQPQIFSQSISLL